MRLDASVHGVALRIVTQYSYAKFNGIKLRSHTTAPRRRCAQGVAYAVASDARNLNQPCAIVLEDAHFARVVHKFRGFVRA